MRVRPKHAAHPRSPTVWKGVWKLLAVLVLGVWLPALSYMVWRSDRDNRPDVLHRVDLDAGSDFVYEIKRLASNQTLWFTYPFGSDRIRLVLQKDSFGTVRTVVASCTACYSFRHEHEFKKGQLICGKCRSAMRLGDPNEEMTPAKSCVAVPVPFSADKQWLTVRALDVEGRMRQLQTSLNPSHQ